MIYGIGEDVEREQRLMIKAASCSGPQWFRNVFKFATDLRVRTTKGSPVLLLPGLGGISVRN